MEGLLSSGPTPSSLCLQGTTLNMNNLEMYVTCICIFVCTAYSIEFYSIYDRILFYAVAFIICCIINRSDSISEYSGSHDINK